MKKIRLLIACCILHAGIYAQSWLIKGNTGTNSATNFIGTTDKKPLRFRVNNIQAGELNPSTGNIFWGLRAGQANTSGFSNIAIGRSALKNNTQTSNLIAIGDSALFNNNGGEFNTAIGSKALFSNTTSNSNTAVGAQSLFSNTTGFFNTANGSFALSRNTTGFQNVAIGVNSLFLNTTGSANTANGSSALFSNITGNNNTAIGTNALFSNTTGGDNTAVGTNALVSNTTGFDNTSVGFVALQRNTTGSNNIATGRESLSSNTTGGFNTALGNQSLFSNTIGSNNTALGFQSMKNTSGSFDNTVIGSNAGAAFNLGSNNTLIGDIADINQNGLSNCVALGEGALCTASSQVRFGNTATVSIGGVVGYTTLSDGRYKKNIQETVKGIDFIMKLRPVMYQLDMASLNKKLNINTDSKRNELSKKDINENEKTIFSGFIAQEVEQAAKDVQYDFSGVDKPKNENDLYGLRYAEFVVPLVKAVQELSQQNTQLAQQNAELIKRMEKLEAALPAANSTDLLSSASKNILVTGASLGQNIPNPFHHTTAIHYTLPQQYSTAKIIVTDNTGRNIKEVIVSGSGGGNINIDASPLASGTYQYSLYIDSKLISTKQMVLTK